MACVTRSLDAFSITLVLYSVNNIYIHLTLLRHSYLNIDIDNRQNKLSSPTFFCPFFIRYMLSYAFLPTCYLMPSSLCLHLHKNRRQNSRLRQPHRLQTHETDHHITASLHKPSGSPLANKIEIEPSPLLHLPLSDFASPRVLAHISQVHGGHCLAEAQCSWL